MTGFFILFFIAVLYLWRKSVINKRESEERKGNDRKRRIAAKRQRKLDAKRDYEFLLDELEAHPSNPKIRRRCLELGREYARLVREDGAEDYVR